MATRGFTLLSAFLGTALALAPAQQPNQAPHTRDNSASGMGMVTVEKDVAYGTVNGTTLRLDIYQPAEHGVEARPAAVLLHGGAWVSFDKSTMNGMGNFLARNGMVAFAVDYRLFDWKENDGKENRWPAQLDDVQRAVRWVRANASKYGVDPQRIGAFGHSAGGQLAALLGMEETRDNSDPALAKYSSKVQATVDFSGLTDFTTDRDADRDKFLAGFLGVDYAKHEDVWREASPAFHVAKDDAPFLIVHGTKDEEVPMSQSQELYDKLKAAGVPVSLVKVEDGHTFQAPESRRRLAMETLAFFHEYLGKGPVGN